MTENPAALCLKGQERRGVFVSVMAAVMAVGALALMAAALVRRAALQLLQNLPQLAHGHIIYLLGGISGAPVSVPVLGTASGRAGYTPAVQTVVANTVSICIHIIAAAAGKAIVANTVAVGVDIIAAAAGNTIVANAVAVGINIAAAGGRIRRSAERNTL